MDRVQLFRKTTGSLQGDNLLLTTSPQMFLERMKRLKRFWNHPAALIVGNLAPKTLGHCSVHDL